MKLEETLGINPKDTTFRDGVLVKAKDAEIVRKIIAHTLQEEGGLVDHPKDPGGITNFGVSLKAYP